ncbi:hypothetical protein JCM19236_1832 [Vibrio sp. JCM 19236]|nr:hypothetical protein JCM19236_1832 [Vibrio sp. JCM 19236]
MNTEPLLSNRVAILQASPAYILRLYTEELSKLIGNKTGVLTCFCEFLASGVPLSL